jgi:hypothetical protein
MSLLLHLAMAGTAGVITFCLTPAITWALYGFEAAKSLGDQYVGLATSTLGRGLLVIRGVGVQLKATSFDADAGTEKTRMGGRRLDWRDPDGRMTRWAGAPFGIALEGKEVITDARQLLLGERFVELRRREDATRELSDGDLARQAFFVFDAGRRVVALNPITRIVQRSAGPQTVSRVKKLTELSQAAYNSRPSVQYLVWLMAFGAGVGVMFLGRKLAGSLQGSGGGTTIRAPPGGMIDLTPLLNLIGVVG